MRQVRLLCLIAAMVITGSVPVQGGSAGAPEPQQAQQLAGQSPAVTLIKARRLLDPRTGNVLSPAAVLIEDGKIKQVGPPERVQSTAPAGVKAIDLGSSTLLPGLIDNHTHLLLDVTVPTEAEMTRYSFFQPGLLLAVAAKSPAERGFLGAQMAREDLESGFTTVRNLGHSGIDGDAALRDAINAGRVPGPRILAAGRKLTAPGGYFQALNPAVANQIVRQEFLEVATVEEARRAVDENLFYNVDVIKVVADDDGVGISAPVLAAIVEEAHRAHKRVAVHAATKTAIQTAIDGGADSIEHGDAATDEQLRMIRDRGIFVDITPTFWNGFLAKLYEASIVMSPEMKSRVAASKDRRRPRDASFIQRILKSGVKFAAGSDMGWHYPGKTRGQSSAMMFAALFDAGMPPLEIIRSVTTNAAELLGWQDRVGAVEPGKFADLIAVAGDPLVDITELERVQFVMKDGQVVRNDIASPQTRQGAQQAIAHAVDLKASDGAILKATYFAAEKPGPGVLLFHQSNRTRETWDDVARRLAAAGINTLTVDNRGHGQSGGLHDKWTDPNREQGKQNWPSDIDTVFEYLASQPGVNRDLIGVGGAGLLGVDNSVEAARRHSAEVKSLALLSGETLLPQLRFLRQASQLPGLFVVSDDDEYPPTAEAMEWLYITSSNPGKKFIHYAGEKAPWLWYEPVDIGRVPATGSHGTDLFNGHPDLVGVIVDWFVTTLIKTPGCAPADAVASASILNQIETTGGVAQVTRQLMEARRRDSKAQLFPEVNVDIIGSDHLRAGELKEAIEVFKLNLFAYPDSADAHSNLANAYLKDGQKELARQCAEKALALLDSHAAPASSWSDTEQRRGEIRSDAQQVLKKLGSSR